MVARPGIAALGSPEKIPYDILLALKEAEMVALQADLLAMQNKQKPKQVRQSCSSETSQQRVRRQQLLQQLCYEAIDSDTTSCLA